MRGLWPTVATLAILLVGCPAGDDDAGDDAGDDDAGDDDAGDDDAGDDDSSEPYPHLAVLGVPDSFVDNGDGSYSLADGSELYDVGLAYYEDHPDDADFLIVWTDFDIAGIFAYSVALGWDQIEGIGAQEVYALYGWTDLDPSDAGSAGALQQIVLMNSPETYDGAAWGAQDILTHEVGHRWSANLSAPWAPDPWVLTDAWYAHWNVHANVGGESAEGYGELLDLGGGDFEFVLSPTLVYSDLELYQQGLLAPGEVGPLFHVAAPHDYDPPSYHGGPWTNDAYCTAVTYQGTRVDFTIDDVIAAHGPRVPAHEDAQTAFRAAFVVVCEDPALCRPETLQWVEQQRVAWEQTYAAATRQLATMDTAL